MLADSAAVRQLGDRLLTPERILFPVRHHSPACAWQLRRLFAEVRPSAVLVEGPRGFTPLIPLLTHPEARMPLAIYSYAVLKAAQAGESPRRAAFYPFCDHSPELVALRAAAAAGIDARFIDLDFAEQCQVESGAEDVDARTLLDERHYRRSRYLTELARRLGCRDHDELWEHLFEVPATSRSLAEHITDIAAYCHLARVECTDEELTTDGTLQREAEMAWHISEALKQRAADAGPVLVVIGGFHAVALPALLEDEGRRPARPSISRTAISDEANALIRYSFDRLDRLNGYGAGMTSPAWQQQVWDRTLQRTSGGALPGARVRQDAALTLLFDIAVELRERHGVALPMPALTGAYEQALRLAALRNRAAPVRDDVLDAITSCFVKGDADADGALVLAVARRAFSGHSLGRVPPGAGTPPLVRDVDYRARRQRLKIDDSEPHRAVLDIYRRQEHRVTSRLFHGLVLLGVPLGMRTAGPDFVRGTGLDRLQEHWEYAHSAATEAALVEASVYGTTLPLAVANRFIERLERLEADGEARDARSGAALLIQACVLGLHDHLQRVVAPLASAITADADFTSVAGAAGLLGLLWESREPLEARDVRELPPLLQAAYERAVYLGGKLGGSADGADAVVSALSRLRELLVSDAGRSLDAGLFWQLVATLNTAQTPPLIRGATTGLLYGAGRLSERQLGEALDGYLNSPLSPAVAVAFLRGLLQTAREAAWQQPGLLAVLDRLMVGWEERDFVAVLPELRLAFAAMTPKETDRIAVAVARLHGAADLGALVRHDVSAAEVEANLAVSARLTELLVADGLDCWMTP